MQFTYYLTQLVAQLVKKNNLKLSGRITQKIEDTETFIYSNIDIFNARLRTGEFKPKLIELRDSISSILNIDSSETSLQQQEEQEQITNKNEEYFYIISSSQLKQLFEFINEYLSYDIQEQQNEFNTLIDKINTTLTDSSLNLIQYEGDVIRSSLNEVWECFFNMDLLKKVAPKLGFAVEREGNAKEHNVGDIIKITYDNKTKFYLCKITMINKHENWNKWIYGFDALYGQPKIPYQKCVVTMTKVNEDEVHLAFFHEFKEAVDHNKIALLSKDKKYFIKSLKEYFAKQNGNKKKKEKE